MLANKSQNCALRSKNTSSVHFVAFGSGKAAFSWQHVQEKVSSDVHNESEGSLIGRPFPWPWYQPEEGSKNLQKALIKIINACQNGHLGLTPPLETLTVALRNRKITLIDYRQ